MAVRVSENSYSPYSNFCVGAALVCSDGKIFVGTNVENSSYGGANCAERTAFFTAMTEGQRSFEAIAIIGHKRGESVSDFCAPCGICRQIMSELGGDDLLVLLYDGEIIKEYRMGELLPLSFDKSML